MKKLYGLLLFVAVFTIAACGGGSVDYPVEYFNATVTGSQVDGDTVTLTIDGEGFYPMTAEVKFVNGSMTHYDIIEHRESAQWGGVLIDNGELQTAIVNNASTLGGVNIGDFTEIDATASATATAEAMMDIARAAVEHFNEFYKD